MRGCEKGVDVFSDSAPPEEYCQDRIFEGIIVEFSRCERDIDL